MNVQFRDYVFGRAFTLHLRESQIKALADLYREGGKEGFIFDGRCVGALMSRGLIVWGSDKDAKLPCRYQPTKAGMLVYDLLVEAGEQEALADKRRRAIEIEDQIAKDEWDARFERAMLKIKPKIRTETMTMPDTTPSQARDSETLEQYADRIVASTRRSLLDRLDDDVIGCLGDSHLVFGKACAVEAIATAMREAGGGLSARVTRLEKHSHPPIDLTPAIVEILADLGYPIKESAAAVTKERDALREARDLAYGLLWGMSIDRRRRSDDLAARARAALLTTMTKVDQANGIEAARAALNETDQ